MSLSNYAEELFLNHVFNSSQTPPTTVYLSLHTADPDEDASGAEVSGGSYVRKAITFAAASGRTITQSGDVDFDQATGDWGTITHYGIWDAATSGNMIAYGALSSSKAVSTGNTATVEDGEVVVTVSSGGISNYLTPIMLDWLFRNQAYSQPTIYVALATATISDSSTGSTITEPSGNGYARVAVSGWDNWASGVVDNTGVITFGPPTGSWGTITDIAIVDASSAGNLLLYDPGAFSETVGDGDTVTFAAGELDITLD